MGVFNFGLMGSIRKIEAPGLELEYIVSYGNSFGEAFERWGKALRDYHGKIVRDNREDLVSDYLGYWTDNGAFYYYHTLEGLNYEDTLVSLKGTFEQMGIPVRHLEIDSWWYPKVSYKGFEHDYLKMIYGVFRNYLVSMHKINGASNNYICIPFFDVL